MLAEPLNTSLAARDLVEMLRRHHLPEGRPAAGIFAHEIEAPDTSRRADAIWAPWAIATGVGIEGYEIKVTRSDVINELADPMKSEPWAKYCIRWWLVVASPSLVAGLTIPDAWGVMAPPSGRRTRSMTVVRQAPSLKPSDTGPAWRRIATWSDYRSSRRLQELQADAERHKSLKEYAELQLTERRLAEGGRVDHRAALIGRILAQLDARPGYYHPEIDVDAVVAAIADLEDVRRLTRRLSDELRWRADEARRVAKPAVEIAAELEKLSKAAEAAA